MLKPTVLIVDDERPTREGLRAALEDRYDVYIAEDGASAMRLLEEDPFDVLLTDLRMPGADGPTSSSAPSHYRNSQFAYS